MQGFFVFNFEKLNSFDSTLAHDPCQNQDHPRILEFFSGHNKSENTLDPTRRKVHDIIIIIIIIIEYTKR